MRFLFALTVLILAVTLALACGDNDGDGPSDGNEAPETHAEDSLARSLLLVVNDFPSGWSETPADDAEEDNPFDECDEAPGATLGRTGVAETGDFSRGGSASVSQEVAVFDTPENGSSVLDRIQGRADCVVEVINEGKLDDDEAEYTDAKFGSLSFPSFGDRTEAHRFEFRVKAKGESGFGSEGTAYIDLIYVVEGRLVFVVQATDVFSPFDTSTLESTVSKAYEKLARAGQ